MGKAVDEVQRTLPFGAGVEDRQRNSPIAFFRFGAIDAFDQTNVSFVNL